MEEREENAAGDRVWVLESNVDDMSPELLAHAAEQIVAAGALDVFIASGLMKKGRPGFQLTVLCNPGDREKVIAAVFSESTAIGLRQRLEERVVLERETRFIQVAGHELRVKVCSWNKRPLNSKPEFADVRRLAEDLGIPIKQAMQMALGAMHEKHGPGKD
jgi:pyridinium-3,5-bisthiocarboxylic acid mononucleotide nickel chelatase